MSATHCLSRPWNNIPPQKNDRPRLTLRQLVVRFSEGPMKTLDFFHTHVPLMFWRLTLPRQRTFAALRSFNFELTFY
jgi:hypothetical protein